MTKQIRERHLHHIIVETPNDGTRTRPVKRGDITLMPCPDAGYMGHWEGNNYVGCEHADMTCQRNVCMVRFLLEANPEFKNSEWVYEGRVVGRYKADERKTVN